MPKSENTIPNRIPMQKSETQSPTEIQCKTRNLNPQLKSNEKQEYSITNRNPMQKSETKSPTDFSNTKIMMPF